MKTADGNYVDPRTARSRARLIDAATSLLSSGGVGAVTIDAVTALSRVARTTLYRQFGSSTHLLAAAFEHLLPPVVAPPAGGDLRARLVDIVCRSAELIDAAPVQLTVLCWVGLGPAQLDTDHAAGVNGDNPVGAENDAVASLRAQVSNRYRQPFEDLLDSPQAKRQLGDFDTTLAITQLVGPVVFARLAGLHSLGPSELTQIVDDFLAGRKAGAEISDRSRIPARVARPEVEDPSDGQA
nr:TetR/AcrR family transcriptional regulator [Antrihabitans stalactiti]